MYQQWVMRCGMSKVCFDSFMHVGNTAGATAVLPHGMQWWPHPLQHHAYHRLATAPALNVGERVPHAVSAALQLQ